MTSGVLLVDPKYPHNVAGAYRAAACFGAESVNVFGDRVDLEAKGKFRLPREERMRAYRDEVILRDVDRAQVNMLVEYGNFTPVCVEVDPSAEQLHHFVHPDNALYVFGPEDGSVPKGWRTFCHRFVVIPSYHCLNLAGAVYTVLYDRVAKRRLAGLEAELPSSELMSREKRGYAEHWE
jgi:tRNA(Leu) C34 or U34 (ribose-2'-O)-methylase TrmL